jgi:oligopeptide/dipeptide ABC transporter ATP-binding protein
MTQPAPVLLEARNLSVRFAGTLAVTDVSLQLRQGEMLGLVGESGSGKTTLARTLLGIQRETEGEILLDGRQVGGTGTERARSIRREVQYVHQDAAASLDPWWRIGASLNEALKLTRRHDTGDRSERIRDLLGLVGLEPSVAARYPHELSGGELRRVALARVLVLEPRIVILDEPTAGLDMSVQATVLGLLADLRRRLGLTYLIISHDLGLVHRYCDRVAILYLGRIVETAPAAALFKAPRHPYTRQLLAAMLSLDPGTALEEVALDELAEPATAGCCFAPRCPHAGDECAGQVPPLEVTNDDRQVACWRWRSLPPSS